MSEVPHPFVVETMQQLEHLSAQEKSKVRLIHLNHTNPLHDPDSGARAEVQRAGFGLAIQGQPLGLDGTSWD
jgi:pyrroloquinoline quinone biosynthesis protein B